MQRTIEINVTFDRARFDPEDISDAKLFVRAVRQFVQSTEGMRPLSSTEHSEINSALREIEEHPVADNKWTRREFACVYSRMLQATVPIAVNELYCQTMEILEG